MGAGAFVVFEGVEGAGKTTQLQLMADRCTAAGVPLLVTREPGGTAIGEELRKLILADHDPELDARTEALLQSAARAQHVAEVIRPALGKEINVVSDRYADSTIAYQGGGQGLSIERLQELQSFATGGLRPDVRVFFDIPVEVGLNRRLSEGSRANRIDRAGLDFHRRVDATFRRLIEQDPDQWLVVDGEQPAEILADAIAEGLRSRFMQFAALAIK